jgi:hypothetical protein
MSAEIDQAVNEQLARASDIFAHEVGLFHAMFGGDLPSFERRVRLAYVHNLADELRRTQGRQPSVAHLSVTTGLPRSVIEEALASDASRPAFRATGGEEEAFESLGLLLTIWQTDTRFSAVYGLPKHLTIRRGTHGSSDDNEATFEDLCALAAPALRIDEVLNLLRDQNLIEFMDQHTIRLMDTTIRYRNAKARSIGRYARLVGGLMQTLRCNREVRQERRPGESEYWVRELMTDRPIKAERADEFMEFLDTHISRWLRDFEGLTLQFGASGEETGRRYGLYAYAVRRDPMHRSRLWRERPGAVTRTFTRSFVTRHRVSDAAKSKFLLDVESSGDAMLNTLDAMMTSFYAPAGENTDELHDYSVVTYLAEIEGSASSGEVIDLAGTPDSIRRITSTY